MKEVIVSNVDEFQIATQNSLVSECVVFWLTVGDVAWSRDQWQCTITSIDELLLARCFWHYLTRYSVERNKADRVSNAWSLRKLLCNLLIELIMDEDMFIMPGISSKHGRTLIFLGWLFRNLYLAHCAICIRTSSCAISGLVAPMNALVDSDIGKSRNLGTGLRFDQNRCLLIFYTSVCLFIGFCR